jgi:hypothetical protein
MFAGVERHNASLLLAHTTFSSDRAFSGHLLVPEAFADSPQLLGAFLDVFMEVRRLLPFILRSARGPRQPHQLRVVTI